MSFTVDEIMERVKSQDAGMVIEFIRDAFRDLALSDALNPVTTRQSILEDRIVYDLPDSLVSLIGVSVLYTTSASELMESEDRTMAAGTGNWTNTDFNSFDKSGDLSLSCNSANQSCYLDDTDIITENHRYRLTYTASIASGTFVLKTYAGDSVLGKFFEGEDNVIEFVAPETDELKIVCTSDSGSADFDDFSLIETNTEKYKPAMKIIGDIPNQYYDEETP